MCDIKAYKKNKPLLKMQDIIKGKILAYGYIADRAGRMKRRFTAEMEGTSQDKAGNLKEYFIYDNGEKQNREWQFQFIDEHHFTATAPDVVGIAKGEQYGNTIHMRYRINLQMKGKTYTLDFDDWQYRINDKVVLNKIKMKKFGFRVGEIIISFEKL
jgi:hypothetical protein